MFFWVKKFIGYWIMPVPACLALFVLGVVLLRSARRERAGRTVVLVATVLFLLFSNKYVSTALVRPLEVAYPAIPDFAPGAALPPALAACRYVVVLGSGNADTPGVSALDELSVSGRARITAAVRILRLLPRAHLLVSGPAEDGGVTHATVLERAAVSLGIRPDRIARIEHARDTEEESLAVKRRIGRAPVVLVTSAWHMVRAMALFHAAGLNPVACPTDYSSQWDGRFHWRDFLWDFESLQRSSYAIHERVGYLWIALRGKT